MFEAIYDYFFGRKNCEICDPMYKQRLYCSIIHFVIAPTIVDAIKIQITASTLRLINNLGQ